MRGFQSVFLLFYSFSFSVILVFALLLTTCQGYSGRIPPDPENPGKCVYHEEVLKLGANPGSGPCQRLTCLEDGSIQIDGCGKLRIETCNRGERINSDQPYPECCKIKYKCKNPDGSAYYITRDVAGELSKSQNST